MAFQAYKNLYNLHWAAGINWVSDEIRVYLVDTGAYTVNLTNHQYLSSIPVSARVAEATLSGKTLVSTATGAAINADDTFFPGVAGVSIEAIAIAKRVTTDADSPLLLWEPAAQNLPLTPDGSGITITWPEAANYIFALSNG